MTTPETCSTLDRGYMGDPRRGASLGRGNRRGDADTAARFHLRRVRLDSGGYDSGGAYWGHGGQLFEAFTDDGAEFMTLRVWPADRTAAFQSHGGASVGQPGWRPQDWTRIAAQDAVRDVYPDARFYR